MSGSDLVSFYEEANDAAKKLGVTTKDIIQSAADWSRLGYSDKTSSTMMAKLAAQFSAISPGGDRAVAPGFCPGAVQPVFHPPENLAPAHVDGVGDDLDFMAPAAQLLGDLGGDARFQLDVHSAGPLHAGRVQALLGVHMVVDGVD